MPEDFFSASVSLRKLFWTFERGSTGFLRLLVSSGKTFYGCLKKFYRFLWPFNNSICEVLVFLLECKLLLKQDT